VEKPTLRDGAGPHADERVDVNQMHSPIRREQDEPEDGFEPVPVVGILLALVLALGSGYYLARNSADFSGVVYDGSDDPGMTVAQADNAPAQKISPLVLGKRTFNNCMACHQQDGKGLSGQFPPLAGSPWVTGSPRVLARILLHGLHGPVTVLGQTYNGIMPAWERFSDEQIAAVLTFIRSSWGNKAEPVLPALIAAERRAYAGRTSAWGADELEKSPP
jgi:mono/diheme cytochrome c family protein